MNRDSEQLTFDTSVVMAKDQPLSPKGIFDVFVKWLGEENVYKETVFGKKVIVYKDGSKKFILLAKCITYLGNPHPEFKKRIQLPDWYQSLCDNIIDKGFDYDVRFIGVYHYEGNIVFVDFLKETYLKHGLHNSSAHVYINDLYQAMRYGMFRKEDKFGNTIVSIRNNKLREYLSDGLHSQNNLFELFRRFNCGFSFGKWLYALDVIKEMHHGEWLQWRQTEWAGWFLEYMFDKFTREQGVDDLMRYVGSSNKRVGDLDFDIRFEEADFYGDLKASDVGKSETPGNDQENLVECIYQYNKFWYVIYEHETIKDSDATGYEATKARNRYIKKVDPKYDKDEMSYHKRMKHSVKFVKMTIIELNKVNFRDALKIFNQGRQPNGTARAPKFNINKETLSNDNYVVFRYYYKGD
ncbi:hypothetical protein [Prevotella koreensis]